jgi:iron complex transport system substrate-binding protein
LCFRPKASPLLAALVMACGHAATPGHVVDDAGRTVALEHPAERIVSLSPSTTELLFAIGAGGRVVGRTQWCEDPPEALTLPSVGDGLDPNLELILALRPDLVVFYQSGSNAPAIERLDALGIATVSARLDRLEDVPRVARMLGQLTGAEARAAAVSESLQVQLEALSSPRPMAPPRVVLLTWDAPPIVIGAGSFLSELIRLAGGENVFDDLPQPSAPVTIEAIVARQPDLVLLVGEDEPDFLRRPEWQVVQAVRERRFAVASGTQFSWPSLRSPAAVRQLREMLTAWH